MAEAADVDAYVHPRPRLEAAVQVGFMPSPQLETALRGFLLPENQRDGRSTVRKIGQIVLKSFTERRFYFEDSNNDGIVFQRHDRMDLAAETQQFERIKNDPIAVTDIGLQIASNHDILVTFPVHPDYLQRRRLGSLVLAEELGDDNGHFLVYKRFNHSDILQSDDDVIRHAVRVRRAFRQFQQRRNDSPLDVVPTPFYVTHPHHTDPRLRKPHTDE